MRRHLANILFLLISITVSGGNVTELFNLGNEAYKQQEYSKALSIYDSINNMGYESAELYFNIGNCYFKTGDVAPAILNYERAKRLSPGDEDIAFNLQLANLRTTDKIEPIPEFILAKYWNVFKQALSSCGWTKIFLTFIWIIFVSIAMILYSNNVVMKRVVFLITIISVLASVLFLTTAWSQHKKEQSKNHAIIFDNNAYVKSSPDENSTDLFIIHEGLKVKVIDGLGEWSKIKLADGKVGWVKKSIYTLI